MGLENDIKVDERRKYVRQICKADIEWSYFNTTKYFDAKLLNFSRGGVYIETSDDITPGATIIMRLGKVHSLKSESADHAYPKLVSMGEVVWHTNLSGQHDTYFRAGVRYPITF